MFKILPCINPDGVIAGNYRVSMSGNDLNRRYMSPHEKLHPIVYAIKKLIHDEVQTNGEDNIRAFIDMHGHSRKKNVFMYGPQFPIHDSKYLKMRILPKLMSEQTEMFRYFSCKFRIQPSKERTARVVLWREFNIMNCFTLEASLHGFFDHTRETRDFITSHFLKIGKHLASTLFEYQLMCEEEDKIHQMKLIQIKQNKLRIRKAQANHKNERTLMSPSASSEANIDDQQPLDNSKMKKMNSIKKKLQNQR